MAVEDDTGERHGFEISFFMKPCLVCGGSSVKKELRITPKF